MKTVCLDLNKWIDLTKASLRRPDGGRFLEALAVARYGVDNNLVRFPISPANYLELALIRNAGQRRRLGDFMAELSQFQSMASQTGLLPAELDYSLNLFFGAPKHPRRVVPFGFGVGHAFDSPDLRIDLSRLSPETLHSRRGLERQANIMFERELLVNGPWQGDPWEALSAKIRANTSTWAEAENARLASYHDWGGTDDELERYMVASTWMSLLDPINASFESAGVDPGALMDMGRSAMTDFILSLPTQAAVYELRKAAFTNPDYRWEPNDLNDLLSLSVAVVHCDIVVAERHWAHFLRRTGLDNKHGTQVLTDVAALPEFLAS